jgi:hypothetical protein
MTGAAESIAPDADGGTRPSLAAFEFSPRRSSPEEAAVPEQLFSPQPGQGRILLRMPDFDVVLSFDADVLEVLPASQTSLAQTLVDDAKSQLGEHAAAEGTSVALKLIGLHGLSIDALVPQIRLDVANDFYRDARLHSISFGSVSQSLVNEAARLKALAADKSSEEVLELLESGAMGDQLVRLRQEQRRTLFACVSCLYACQEAVLYQLALQMHGHDRSEANRITGLRGLQGWKKLFDHRGIEFSDRRGLGTEDETLAVKPLAMRNEMTHSGDLYLSIQLNGASPPVGQGVAPTYEELWTWVDAVRDVLRLYSRMLGHPECADLRLLESDLPTAW